jgi:methylmalonyl-CoA/ethylmalonyl-CoA epimerase
MIRPLHLGISVPDMDASVEWYREMLGFNKISDEFVEFLNARTVFMQLGDFQIELFQ